MIVPETPIMDGKSDDLRAAGLLRLVTATEEPGSVFIV
jgi:hypothetical protein